MPDQISSNSDTKPIGTSPSDKPWYEPMTTGIDRIANYAERAREHAPTLIEIGPVVPNGLVSAPQAFSTRLRIKTITFDSLTAGTFVISFGGRSFTFMTQASITLQLDWPYEIDRGIDIMVTRTVGADNPWNFYIWAYTE